MTLIIAYNALFLYVCSITMQRVVHLTSEKDEICRRPAFCPYLQARLKQNENDYYTLAI